MIMNIKAWVKPRSSHNAPRDFFPVTVILECYKLMDTSSFHINEGVSGKGFWKHWKSWGFQSLTLVGKGFGLQFWELGVSRNAY